MDATTSKTQTAKGSGEGNLFLNPEIGSALMKNFLSDIVPCVEWSCNDDIRRDTNLLARRGAAAFMGETPMQQRSHCSGVVGHRGRGENCVID